MDEIEREKAKALALAEAMAASEAEGQADAPWYQDAAQAAGDILRIGSNAVTLGFRDKLAPMLTGRTVEEERSLTQEARDRAGSAGLATELGGGMVLPGGIAKAGLSVASAPAVAGMSGIKGLMARSALMGLEGEALSSATAAGNDQEYQPGVGMAAGALGNIAGEGLSAGIGKIANALMKKPPVPSVDDFMAAKSAAYKSADDAGVVFTPQAMQRLRDEVGQEYASKAFHPKLQPRAAAPMEELDRLANQNVTLSGLDTARQIAGDAFEAGNKKNNMLSRSVADRIDDLVANPRPGDVLMGDAEKAGKALAEGRKYYHQGSKLQKVNELFERGEFNASTSGSGGNLQNATRQQLKRILTNKGWDRGFTADEKKAIEEFVKGGSAQNFARAVGAMSPSGNGLGKMLWAMGTGGAALANPMTLPLMLGGAGVTAGTKKIAEALTRSSFDNLQRTIASGGAKAPQSATKLLAESKRDAIARALMAIGVQQGVTAGR